jgi:hypothetical protein
MFLSSTLALVSTKFSNSPFSLHIKMQLETVIPPHRALASLGIAFEDFVIVNALVVAHRNTSAVDETDARTLSEAEQLKKQHHLHRQAALHLHEAVIRKLVRKQIRQMSFYKEHIVMLEITERVEVEVDENGHHFRIAHETFSMAVFTSIRCFERFFLYLSVIFFAKIIDNTENFSNFVLGYHREYFCFVCLFCHYKDNKKFPNIQIFNDLCHCCL